MPAERPSAEPHEGARAGPPPADGPVRVLTVDDQPVFRRVARDLLAATDGFLGVGEAASGREALQLATDLDPDLVLVDLRMPGMDGIETARRMAVAHPRAIVVLISLEEPMDLPSAAASVGAVAHVRKQELSPQVLHDLWAAHGRPVQRA